MKRFSSIDQKLESTCEQALAMCLSTPDNPIGNSIQIKIDIDGGS